MVNLQTRETLVLAILMGLLGAGGALQCSEKSAIDEFRELHDSLLGDFSIPAQKKIAPLEDFIKRYADDQEASLKVGHARQLLAMFYARAGRKRDALAMYNEILEKHSDDDHLINEATKAQVFLRMELLEDVFSDESRQLAQDIQSTRDELIKRREWEPAAQVSLGLSMLYDKQNKMLESAKAFDPCIDGLLTDLKKHPSPEAPSENTRLSKKDAALFMRGSILENALKGRAHGTIWFLREYIESKPVLSEDKAKFIGEIADALSRQAKDIQTPVPALWLPESVTDENKQSYLANTVFGQVQGELHRWRQLQANEAVPIPDSIANILDNVQEVKGASTMHGKIRHLLSIVGGIALFVIGGLCLVMLRATSHEKG